MNFLDSLFDKIPLMRDMDKKRRMLLAGFAVFAIISILGILIEAIVGAEGVIAVIAVVVGFLFMAAIILIDFFMSGRNDDDSQQLDNGYNFFNELDDDNISYQNDSFDYQMTEDNPANIDYGSNIPADDFSQNANVDVNYGNDFEVNYEAPQFDNGGNEFNTNGFEATEPVSNYAQPTYEMPEQSIEYTTAPEQIPEEQAPRRFGGVFRRGQTNENTVISDEIANAERDYGQGNFRGNGYEPVRSSFEFTREPDMSVQAEPMPQPDVQMPYNAQNSYNYQPTDVNVGNDYIGKPVMTFPASTGSLQEEVARTADFVAPNVVAPVIPESVGGPVMSIPSRASYNPTITETPVQPTVSQPVQSYQAPQYNTSTQPRVPAYQQGTRGQEIEEFFDHMSDDELLYSDCVEVWAADAKPAAIRLLKQIESLPDKKKADSLGREAEYVNAMIDRIYYFTMLDSIRDNLELKKYNFSIMVKECLRRFSPFFMEKRIGLLWKGLDIDIITDKRWLIFALTQVIFNAVEFTGLGGKIAISAKKEGSLIHLMVDDSGCGISDDDLPRIFMAGFMGDNVPNESGRRTGMGLFITRSVVEKLGGTVTAESSSGKGTRITIILPEKP